MRATAARVIREHGYDSATMDLLAEEVGLNKGTLYHYYPSKSAILYELMSDQIDVTLGLIPQVPGDGPIAERMRVFVRLQVETVSTKQDELVVFFQELRWINRHLPEDQAASLRGRVNEYQRFAASLIEDGIKSGEFRPLSTRIVLSSFIGILAYVPEWFVASSKRARQELVDELTEFVMRGIVA